MAVINRWWWLRPLVMATVLFLVVVFLAQGRTIAPFVYSLF
jgi:hypothetical protein